MTAHRNTAEAPSTAGGWGSQQDEDEDDLKSGYVVHQCNRTAVRALQLALSAPWSVAELREGKQRLAQVAAKHQLRVLEPPLAALHANPAVDPKDAWTWHLLQPVCGKVVVAELDDGITVGRTLPGTYLQTSTTDGLAGLDRLYDYLFSDYLPRYKHRLTRPCIYHRVTEGAQKDNPDGLLFMVFLPVMLSLVRGELGPSISPNGDQKSP
ncbi:MAG: hypothetical protein JRI23_08740 [Deltaproteobacteria bacterium]|jgi:DNA gyrase inhibitor GyrI|nr:hypothetical protein [Deltaproteobacteria bacterium]MBW2531702.1 hypothetical protein [Deltaproteobacteria bacterium]